MSLIKEMLSYTFLLRAIIVGGLVSLCAAVLGVPLVLKRYSMIGDGLSHVGFGALAVAAAMNAAPLSVAIPVVVAAAFLLLRLSASGKVKGDAAIAVVSTGSLALGVIVISLSTGMNTETSNYLFGSILSMSEEDVRLCLILTGAVLLLFILFYHHIFAVTFDETFARATGKRAGACNALLALLTALTVVVGMRLMGSLLISGLVIFPALSAMRLCREFRHVIIVSAVLSLVCFLFGTVASFALAIPTGASVVCMDILVLLVCFGIGRMRERG